MWRNIGFYEMSHAIKFVKILLKNGFTTADSNATLVVIDKGKLSQSERSTVCTLFQIQNCFILKQRVGRLNGMYISFFRKDINNIDISLYKEYFRAQC